MWSEGWEDVEGNFPGKSVNKGLYFTQCATWKGENRKKYGRNVLDPYLLTGCVSNVEGTVPRHLFLETWTQDNTTITYTRKVDFLVPKEVRSERVFTDPLVFLTKDHGLVTSPSVCDLYPLYSRCSSKWWDLLKGHTSYGTTALDCWSVAL